MATTATATTANAAVMLMIAAGVWIKYFSAMNADSIRFPDEGILTDTEI